MTDSQKAGPDRVPPAAALFPTGCSIAWSDSPVADATLLPAERQLTAGMAPARLQSFAQGRACAHEALAKLGYPDRPVPVGEQRAPLWPAGVTGSIAHCAGRAIAVAARQEVLLSVGVDLEIAGVLDTDVQALVCTAAEDNWLSLPGNARYACAIFAIKESVYKCLWPLVRRFVDFQEVTTELDAERGRYLVRTAGSRLDPAKTAAICGRWTESNGMVCASAYLPSTPVL